MVSILQSGRGGLICETKLPMQELELKMQGGLCARGGGNRGILRYNRNGLYMYMCTCTAYIEIFAK